MGVAEYLVCYARHMRNAVSVTGLRFSRCNPAPGQIAKAYAAFLIVLLIGACGGDAKDRTRQTNNEPHTSADAARDAGPEGAVADASREDASQVNESSFDDGGGGTGSEDTTSGSASDDATGAGSDETHSSTSTSDSTASPTDSTTSTREPTTRAEDTSDSSGSTLQPDWVPIEPIAEGLSDCSANLQQNETWCSYPVNCGDSSLISRCVLTDDVWQCTCRNGSAPQREYTLAGEMATTPCEVSIALCVPNQAPEPAQVCEIANESLSVDYCAAVESCVTTIELNDNLTAVVTAKSAYSECSGEERGSMLNCRCSNRIGSADLYEVTVEEACKAVLPWCKTGFPVPDETWEFACTDETVINPAASDTENEVDRCIIQRECGRRLDVGQGFAVLEHALQSVECEGSSCTCDGDHHILVEPSGDSDAATCIMLDEFCYGDVTATPIGAISITNEQMEGDETSCSGAATAEQWVSWGEGAAVGLTGDIWTFCEPTDSLTWSCRCASSGSDSENFELQGSDSTQPCEGALDRCTARARVVPTLNTRHPHRARFEFLPESAMPDAGQ